MLKFFTICLSAFLICFSSDVSAQSVTIDSSWNNHFIERYSKAIIKNDSALYIELLISQHEMDSIVTKLKIENPNCITDIEQNMTANRLEKQFHLVVSFFRNLKSLNFGKGYEINGCGDIKGLKFNIYGSCGPQKAVRSRTLTFLKFNNDTYRLLFDIPVGNSN